MILTIYSVCALILSAWELQLPINSSVKHEMQVQLCFFLSFLSFLFALHFVPFNTKAKSNNCIKWFLWNHLKINECFWFLLSWKIEKKVQTIVHLQSIMKNKCLLIFQVYGAHPTLVFFFFLSQSLIIFALHFSFYRHFCANILTWNTLNVIQRRQHCIVSSKKWAEDMHDQDEHGKW